MISNDGHSTSGSAVHKKALSDLKTNQTSPRDKNGKNYVLQNNSTGLSVFLSLSLFIFVHLSSFKNLQILMKSFDMLLIDGAQ